MVSGQEKRPEEDLTRSGRVGEEEKDQEEETISSVGYSSFTTRLKTGLFQLFFRKVLNSGLI